MSHFGAMRHRLASDSHYAHYWLGSLAADSLFTLGLPAQDRLCAEEDDFCLCLWHRLYVLMVMWFSADGVLQQKQEESRGARVLHESCKHTRTSVIVYVPLVKPEAWGAHAMECTSKGVHNLRDTWRKPKFPGQETTSGAWHLPQWQAMTSSDQFWHEHWCTVSSCCRSSQHRLHLAFIIITQQSIKHDNSFSKSITPCKRRTLIFSSLRFGLIRHNKRDLSAIVSSTSLASSIVKETFY